MMDVAALIARMDEQRARWVDLPDGKRVRVRRPLETEFHRLRAGIGIDHVCEFACGWDGFAEADLLGSAVGSSDALAFAPALWSRVARDRAEYVQPVAQALIDAITEHIAAKAAVEKN